MFEPSEYQAFLDAKVALDPFHGYPCDPSECHPLLRGHQRDVVAWNVEKGRAGDFASFGLGKTLIELETARLTLAKCGGRRALVVMPLGVRQEFARDAAMVGTPVRFVRTTSEALDARETILLTNYESVRANKVDLGLFDVLLLDEAAVLRSFGSETFGEFLFGDAMRVPHRFVATATPSPNRLLELIAYAHFLGVMDMGLAKTRFFQRNSSKADDLTLMPGKEEEFWTWVHSWGLFLERPSDLGHSDEGYVLPELEVVWHRVDSPAAPLGTDRKGQGVLLKDASLGVSEASREKRESLAARIAKAVEIRRASPHEHFVWWHDREDERAAIERAWPSVVTVYGKQDDGEKESAILGFADGSIADLGAKKVMLGSGCNFQRHCHRAIYVGIDYFFADFFQSVHRLQRFGQARKVRIDLVYTEAEEGVREALLAKWELHRSTLARMSEIVREHGLRGLDRNGPAFVRAMDAPRREASGEGWRMVNCDSIEEARRAGPDSVDLIATSPAFEGQYEYAQSFRDFGFTDDLDHFLRQMEFLTPNLLRILRPGRNLVVHIKDRVVPGEITGLGFQTISPTHAHLIAHCMRHGFAFMGMVTIDTDVVRENNSSNYRLSWTEQCKDGSRMGAGMSEFLLVFRKPPSDLSNGYADVPVAKGKAEYSLGRWQLDASGFWRSSGNGLVTVEEFARLTWKEIYGMFREASPSSAYDYELHVRIQDALDAAGRLPRDFSLIPARATSETTWSDVFRAGTLNTSQNHRRRDKHVCPFPKDIARRIVRRWSNPGDVVLDPFSGIGTMPVIAMQEGRTGEGWELHTPYWEDGAEYCRIEEAKRSIPNLFPPDELAAFEEADVA